MKENANKTRWVFCTCLVYLLLTIFYYHITKYLNGAVFIILFLLIPTTFIMIFVYAIKGLNEVLANITKLTLQFCLPTIFASTTLLYTFFSPWRLYSENLMSKVEMWACYEGTQNQSIIKYREDKSFEIKSSSFGVDVWTTGKWKKNKDTLFMKFDKKGSFLLGDTIIIYKEKLVPIEKINQDSLLEYNRFYNLGYCHGEN